MKDCIMLKFQLKRTMKKVIYLAFENSVMFQMFQYSIKGVVFKKFNMNPENDNVDEITFLIYLLTEITLWYTMYVHWRIEGGQGPKIG